MTRHFLALTFFLLFNVCSIFGQSIDSINVKLIGDWTLYKHTLLEKGKNEDKFNPIETKIIYEFKRDFTYKLISTWKFQDKGDSIITVGKWKISADKKQINLYDNKFLPPHDKDGICADHPLKIVKLTKTDFVTEEYIYNEFPVGISYYKKQ